MMAASRLENVTQTIARILEGYDIRLRPNFGGKMNKFIEVFFFHILEKNIPNQILCDSIQCGKEEELKL